MRPGYARVDLGSDGRFAQVLVDASDSLDQVHVTFFDRTGQRLDIGSASLTGTSPSGGTVEVPIALFEPGHFAASTDLELGDWRFELRGVALDDQAYDVSFTMTIE